jgi:hypothetical protein
MIQRFIQFITSNPRQAIQLVVLEGLFIGIYHLLENQVNLQANIYPLWIAWLLTCAAVFDLWAVWYKAHALRFLESEGAAYLPVNGFLLFLFWTARYAVFSLVLIETLPVITGVAMDEKTMNWILVSVGIKELFVLAFLAPPVTQSKLKTTHEMSHAGFFSILHETMTRLVLIVKKIGELFFTIISLGYYRKNQSAIENKPPSFVLLLLADAIIIITAQYSVLFLETLFNVPTLDVSWNFIFFLVMLFITIGMYFFFFLPFRILYYLDNSPFTITGAIDIAIVIYILFSLLGITIYSSNKATEAFELTFQNRPDERIFVFNEKRRLKARDIEKLCSEQQIEKIVFHSHYTGYLPKCIYEMPALIELDAANNRLPDTYLRGSKSLKVVNFSNNEFKFLSDLGISYSWEKSPDNPAPTEYLNMSNNLIKEIVANELNNFVNLQALDLSGNPLENLHVPDRNYLPKLEILNLSNTLVTDEMIQKIRKQLPGIQIIR